MVNGNATLIETSSSYSILRMLGELSPISGLAEGLIALAVAAAVLAIFAVVGRGMLDVEEGCGSRALETAAGVARVLAFVVIIASMSGLLLWILQQMGETGMLQFALLSAR